MPGDNELQQIKENLLNKDIRVANEHHAGDLRNKNRSLYDQTAIRKDNQDIDAVLKSRQLTAEELSNLEMIKGRNLSSLLVLEEKKTGDSRQMKAVKRAISAVETGLNKDRLGIPFTEKDVDELLRLYDTAILACRDYVRDKDPSYARGKERLALVRMNVDRLHEEAEALLVAKELIRTGVLDGLQNTGRDLLTAAGIYGLTAGNKVPEGEEQVPELPDEKKLKDCGYEVSMLYRAFSGQEMPSDMIRRLSKSRNKKEQDFAIEMTQLFANVRSSLKDFRAGKVAAKVFLIGNMVISVQQNVFGQLTLNVGDITLPLERHCGIIADMLASDIVNNEELYGEKNAKAVIRDAIDGIGVRNFGTEKRQILTDYLAKHTRYSVTDFANFEVHDVAYMIRSLFAGKNLYVIDSELSTEWELTDNDVVFTKNHGSLINVMESREMLRSTQDEKNREKVKEKVKVSRPEEKKEQEKKEDNKEQEEKEGEWSEKEQKVVNLLGDVIFSYDTWTADEKRQDPGKRMQLALAKNSDALAYIISDMFSPGKMNMKTVNGMLDRMPLFMMEKKQAEDFRKTVIKALNDAAVEIKNAVDNMITRKLGKRPEGFFAGLKYDTAKFAASGAANLHLMNADALRTGLEIKNNDGEVVMKIEGLNEIIMDLDEETLGKLALAENAIDQGVKAASDTIQKTVSKYSGELFKPKKKKKEKLPDPYAPGLDEEEKRRLKKERYEAGNRILGEMVADSMTSGESGQGLFTRLVFEKYFKGVETVDQRSMLASMIRSAKPVGKLLDENEAGLDEDVKKLRREHNEKVMAESMGNYIGGLLKGAGPLFQKMMQGLPLEGLPAELRSAVKDMKSKLASIPDEIVEAQLYSMAQRSHGQVSRIEVVKPLGAASVGQTFLCKLTRADGKEEEVAVKLLKPDVTNRMMREKQLMIDCARETDIESRRIENERRMANNEPLLPEIKRDEKGGMQVTYEGQLERIQEELDLTIEARNVELGKIYDKVVKEDDDKVRSMKLNQLSAPTTNSMVLEKAPGETIDTLLERVKTETERLRDLYKRKILPGMSEETKESIREKLKNGNEYYGNIVQLAEDRGIPVDSDEYANLQPARIEEKLAELVAELKRKKEYLDIFARKWTEEGLFQEGFYHGDPHDGNIMVSDEKLTVIDFGNCTQLSAEQQEHVTRMMSAAAVGDMELFRSGLHALLKPEFEKLYQQKRDELGKEIRYIFKHGDQRSAGARIMVALLKAQEMGLEVPSAVYNFSQGQIRIQNTLANMNSQIEETEKAISLVGTFFGEGAEFDITEEFRSKQLGHHRPDEDQVPGDYLKSVEHDYFKENVRYTRDRAYIRELADTQFDSFKKSFIDPLKIQTEKQDNILRSFRNIINVKKNLPPEALNQQNWPEAVRLGFNDTGDIVDADMQRKILEEVSSEEKELSDKWVEDMEKEILDRIRRVRAAVDSFGEAETIRNAVQAKNKGKWKPTEEEKARFAAACDHFAEAYTPVHAELAEGNELFIRYFRKWAKPEKFSESLPGIKNYFKVYPEGEEEFMKAYNVYVDAHEKKLQDKDPDAFREAEKALKSAYHDVITARFKKKADIFAEAADGKKVDFLGIMGDVLDEQLPKLVWRMGIFRSIMMNWKLNRQKKEYRSIGLE